MSCREGVWPGLQLGSVELGFQGLPWEPALPNLMPVSITPWGSRERSRWKRAWASPEGALSPSPACFGGCRLGSGEGWEVGKSHLNLPCSWAFFRTSSREEPAGTETECLYEGEMPETFSMTSMNSGTWVCGRISVDGSNRAIPGRGEGAAALRIQGQALVLLSFQEDTAAHWDLLLPLGPLPVNTTTTTTQLLSRPPQPLSSHIPHHPSAGPSLVSLLQCPPPTYLPPQQPRGFLTRTYICSRRPLLPLRDPLLLILLPSCHSSSSYQTPRCSETLPPVPDCTPLSLCS